MCYGEWWTLGMSRYTSFPGALSCSSFYSLFFLTGSQRCQRGARPPWSHWNSWRVGWQGKEKTSVTNSCSGDVKLERNEAPNTVVDVSPANWSRSEWGTRGIPIQNLSLLPAQDRPDGRWQICASQLFHSRPCSSSGTPTIFRQDGLFKRDFRIFSQLEEIIMFGFFSCSVRWFHQNLAPQEHSSAASHTFAIQMLDLGFRLFLKSQFPQWLFFLNSSTPGPCASE